MTLDGKTLLVGRSEKTETFLQPLFQSAGIGPCSSAFSGAEARRMLVLGDYSFVVINSPLPDEPGIDLAMMVAQSTFAGVLLLVKADMADAVAQKVEDCGVLVVSKPVSKPLFEQTLRLSMIVRNRMQMLQNQNAILQKKIEEMRMVDRAKCALIQFMHVTEQQAHRLIEKQAMDTRQSKMQVAKDIIITYEIS
jgi:two-component system, response regulator PdtaR